MNFGQVKHIPLARIRENPDNPNPHSDKKLKSLAANIKEFGLIHPILLKPDGKNYEIIAGHGRFRAFRALGSKDIPAFIASDSSDYKDWGRRLSENKLRSFNWVAECIELANMRTSGKDNKQLGLLFDLSPRSIETKVSIGNSIQLNGAKKAQHVALQNLISERSFRDYILPLRINTRLKGFDYSEVKECITKLVNGKLKVEDLPVYSAERRVAILEAQKEDEIEKRTQKQAQKLEENYNRKIKELEALYRDKIKELGQQIEAKEKELEDKITKIEEASGEEQKKLKKDLRNLKKETENLSKEKEELEEKFDNILEIHKEELRKELEKDIQAKKDKGYERDLKKREQELKKQAKDLKEAQKAFDELKKSGKLSADRWVNTLVSHANALYRWMELGRKEGIYSMILEREDYQDRIYSSLRGTQQELKQFRAVFADPKYKALREGD